jgi:pimeloyl-ACP methyl ester carboxylesterase
MRRGFIDTPDGQVFYLDSGKGDAVVLLHQSPRSSSMWLDVMPMLSERYRPLAIDMLGYGLSAAPPVKDGKGDVAAVGRSALHLIDALQIEQAHLVGFHTGAYMAVQAALEAPKRCKSLTLLGYPVIEEAGEIDHFFAARNLGLSRYTRPPRGADGAHVLTAWAAGYAQVTKNWLVQGGPQDKSATDEGMRYPSPHRHMHTFMSDHEIDFVERYMADARLAKFILPIYQVMIQPSNDLLRRVEVPTLAVEFDTVHESVYCRRAKRMAEIMPKCEALILQGVDDNVTEFAPEVFVSSLESFIAKHR